LGSTREIVPIGFGESADRARITAVANGINDAMGMRMGLR
jgi:hypothetical protein